MLQTTTVDSPNDATLALATLPGRPSGEKTQLNNTQIITNITIQHTTKRRPKSAPKTSTSNLSGGFVDHLLDFFLGRIVFFLFTGGKGYLFTRDPRKVLRPAPLAGEIEKGPECFEDWSRKGPARTRKRTLRETPPIHTDTHILTLKGLVKVVARKIVMYYT